MARPREPKNPKSCQERALGLLAVRPRSRRELERRLLAASFEPEEVRDVLTRLERVGLVDDEAFARQYAEHRFGSRKEGSRGVERGLRAAGIAPALAATMAEETPDDDEERAAELARSRASRLTGVAPQKAFARLSSLLMRRGYSPEIARSAARMALDIAFHEE
ncbi:MAG: RecX family transcriptional regulator [Actinomycetota bacterium]|nr:RecX family transcriptional regulator [Actinomycetota bacterium]